MQRFLLHLIRLGDRVGRTPLDERSARRRDLNLTTHNTQKDTDMRAPGGMNPQSQQASGPRPTTLDRAATAVGTRITGKIILTYTLLHTIHKAADFERNFIP